MARLVSWTARVDWELFTEPTRDEMDAWVDALAGYAPAVAYDLGHDTIRGSATITLETPRVRQAFAAAVRAVEDATGRSAIGVEVITTAEHDRRQAEPQIPPLVGLAEVGRMLDVSRQRAGQLADRDDFPPEVARTANGPLFIKQHIDAFAKRWDRKPGRPATKS